MFAHLFDHLITKCENDQQPIDAAAQHRADRLAFAIRIQRRIDEQNVIAARLGLSFGPLQKLPIVWVACIRHEQSDGLVGA